MNSYTIVFKYSHDLTENEWNDYILHFNSIFKRNYSFNYFKNKYFGSVLGYSFHAILYFENSIVGMFSVIPRKYSFFGKEIILGLACDAFILPIHRSDEMFLKQMSDAVIEELKKSEIFYIVSIPNPIAYPYWKYFAGWKDISYLNYYIIPLRFGNILKKWHFINFFSINTIKLLIWLSKGFYKSSFQYEKNIHLIRDQKFITDRYFDDYIICKFSNNSGCIYRIFNEDGIRTAYLIDCNPLTKRTITRSINKILADVESGIDMIMFVGKIEHLPYYFIKVPQNREPRKQPFIGLCLTKSYNEEFFNINNWDISLANFDNR